MIESPRRNYAPRCQRASLATAMTIAKNVCNRAIKWVTLLLEGECAFQGSYAGIMCAEMSEQDQPKLAQKAHACAILLVCFQLLSLVTHSS